MKETHVLPKRGEYHMGHGVVCKHCGRSHKEHNLESEAQNISVRKKRYRHSLQACRRYGYEPANKSKWLRLEKAYIRDKESEFRMEMFVKDAQRRAAWGGYAQHVRQQNYDNASEEERKVLDKQARQGGFYIG